MKPSPFDPEFQQKDLSSKIVVGMERIAEVFRKLLWDHAKIHGLSPIQIQILIFLKYHDSQLRTVSHLSDEFNMTKATVSNAIKVLLKKGYVFKDPSAVDNRSYSIGLTEQGVQMVEETVHFAQPIKNSLDRLEPASRDALWKSIYQLISNFHQAGLLTVQRTCFSCRFLGKQSGEHYCKLLKKTLLDQDIRIDCPEFERK